MIRVLFFFILFSSLVNASCLTEREYNELVLKSLPDSNDDYYETYPYGIIQNMADCSKSDELSNLVCHDAKLKKSLLLLSIGEIYAYENATHTPVEDYSTYNDALKSWLNDLISKEDNKKTALRKLCYIIKTKLSNDFGEGFYYAPKVHEIISSKTNKNGVVIDSLSRVIYLGKSCDAVVLGEEKVKSIWYKDGEQFVIVHKDNDGLLQEDYRFYLDDKVAKLNCDKP